jgi:hypothetical protein
MHRSPPSLLPAQADAPEEEQARRQEQCELSDLPWTHRTDGSRKRAPGQSRGRRLIGRLLIALLLVGFGLDPGLAALNAVTGAAPGPDLPQFLSRLRVIFYHAVDSSVDTEEAVAAIRSAFPLSLETWPPVIRAYYAALEGLRGKHARGLGVKLGHVMEAISLMRRLPEDSPRSIEIRFLRFSLFRQLPLFFGVRSTVRPDLEALIRLLEEGSDDEVPPAIQRDIVTFLLDCTEASQDQLGRLRQVRGLLEATPSP